MAASVYFPLQYIIADQAFFRHSMCGVPLYDTLGEEAVDFIVNQGESLTQICFSKKHVSEKNFFYEEPSVDPKC